MHPSGVARTARNHVHRSTAGLAVPHPTLPPKLSSAAQARTQSRKPQILYEDNKALVINKPSNCSLQGQHGTTARNNWNGLLQYLRQRPESPEVFPVHRLDKATTGTLLLAKNRVQAKALAKAFTNHQVKRQYLAVVSGRIKLGYTDTVEAHLRVDDDKVRVTTKDDQAALASRTFWRCLSSSSTHSLLCLEPETGRKHQLRVHCSLVLKAPIVGDFKYGHLAQVPGLASDAMLLHAYSLSFYIWKKDGKRVEIRSVAPPPRTFARFCREHGLELPEDTPLQD
ncbi:hypothetical protein OIV83_000754 [Microbotryomycetes sp. JL201]|nr:hypothetical protein OIV83_000754 [Microbotryomycetes sp. JL201]